MVAAKRKMTYTALADRIKKELGKETTDQQTWDVVDLFWKYDKEVAPELFDQIVLLQNRMYAEHEWSREDPNDIRF